MKAKLKDIAEKTGLSLMTVSRALNSPKSVKQQTRQRVLRVVKQLNYHPNHIARSLVKGRTQTIGLLIPDISNRFFPAVVRGGEELADEKGYHFLLCHTREEQDKEAEEIETLLGMRVDGLIIAPANSNDANGNYQRLKRSKVPFVLIDRYWQGTDCSYVVCRDRLGAEQATSHLIELGHKRIGHLAGPFCISTAENRLKGYKRALKQHGMRSERELIVEAGVDKEAGYQAMGKLLALKKRPSAVFAFNDELAMGAIKAAEAKGLKLPQDISLIGFSDLPEAAMLKTPLSTVRQPKEEVGRLAMEILLAKIESKAKVEQQITLDTELVIRGSCAEHGGMALTTTTRR